MSRTILLLFNHICILLRLCLSSNASSSLFIIADQHQNLLSDHAAKTPRRAHPSPPPSEAPLPSPKHARVSFLLKTRLTHVSDWLSREELRQRRKEGKGRPGHVESQGRQRSMYVDLLRHSSAYRVLRIRSRIRSTCPWREAEERITFSGCIGCVFSGIYVCFLFLPVRCTLCTPKHSNSLA